MVTSCPVVDHLNPCKICIKLTCKWHHQRKQAATRDSTVEMSVQILVCQKTPGKGNIIKCLIRSRVSQKSSVGSYVSLWPPPWMLHLLVFHHLSKVTTHSMDEGDRDVWRYRRCSVQGDTALLSSEEENEWREAHECPKGRWVGRSFSQPHI